MNQRPLVVGLQICEQVIVEEGTRNVTLVNCFLRMKVNDFPSEGSRFAVFAILTDGLGDVRLEIVVSRLSDQEVIFRQANRVRFLNPLREVRFLMRMRRCSFPTPGEYEVSLFADGEHLTSHRFEVTERE